MKFILTFVLSFPVYIILSNSCYGVPVKTSTSQDKEVAARKTVLLQAKTFQDVAKCDTLLANKDKVEIASFKDKAEKIIYHVINGSFSGRAYKELSSFVEQFPHRPSGDKKLENAIDYLMDLMRKLGLENVRNESVKVPVWNGEDDKAVLVRPVEKTLRILTVQNTTKSEHKEITAYALIVRSFEELDKRSSEVEGKIVVFNQGFFGRKGHSHFYSTNGASYAAQYGAVAALVQSNSYTSLDNPIFAPLQYWNNTTTQIPCAYISMEDANFLYSLQESTKKELLLHLSLNTAVNATSLSRNAIGELPGHLKKDFVALTAHTDCSDEGGGASDASAAIIPLMALAALKDLKMAPHRTLLALLFTSNEWGLWGATSYIQEHKKTMPSYSAILESDAGAFKALGIDFAGSEKAGCIIREILKLCQPILIAEFARFPSLASDSTAFIEESVPALSLHVENKIRLQRRHQESEDTIYALDSSEIDEDVALWAVVSYVLAEIPKLPR